MESNNLENIPKLENNADKARLATVETEGKIAPGQGAKWSKSKPKRWLWLILGLIFVALLIITGYFLYNPKVNISVTQKDARITIDNQKITGKTQIKPGKHTIVISQSGFVPYTYTDNIKPFQNIEFQIDLRVLPQPKLVVEEKVFATSFSIAGDKFYYLGNDGKTLYEVKVLEATDGVEKKLEKTRITPDNLDNLAKVIFSPEFDVAIFKYKNGETGLYDFKRYDLLNQEYKKWGDDIGDVAWSPDGKKALYYFAPKSGERSLVISDRAHSEIKRIRDLSNTEMIMPSNDVDTPQIEWSPNGESASLLSKGNLYLIDIDTGNLSQVQAGQITSVKFAPDSKHLLFTKAGDLYYQDFQLVDALSGKKEDQDNVGKIAVVEAKKINLKAQASKGIFTKTGDKIVIISDDGLKEINSKTLEIAPFYLASKLTKVDDLGLSSDGNNLFILANDKLISVPLDKGQYLSTREIVDPIKEASAAGNS